jgi:hypothetical protein
MDPRMGYYMQHSMLLLPIPTFDNAWDLTHLYKHAFNKRQRQGVERGPWKGRTEKKMNVNVYFNIDM